MSYQNITNSSSDSESSLLSQSTGESSQKKSNSIVPKVIMAGVISFVLLATLAIYHPFKVQNVSASVTNLSSQLGNEFSRETHNNAST